MATCARAKWAALFLSLVVLATAWLQPLDRLGADAGERAFQRALAAFAVARTLNAVISLAKGTEVAVQPAGVGISFSAGEVLDPVNDLVEQFSWLMLTSSAVLGLQLLLGGIMGSPGVSATITIALGAATALLWADRAAPLRRALFSVAVVLVTLRFLFPVMALAQEVVHRLYLADSYSRSLDDLQVSASQFRELAEVPPDERPEAVGSERGSWWERLSSTYDSLTGALKIEARMRRLQEAAEEVTERIIQLIVAFLLETVVIPLGFLWAALATIRAAARWALGAQALSRPLTPGRNGEPQ